MNKIVPYIKYVKELQFDCKPKSMQLNVINRCASKCVFCKKWKWNLPDMPKERIESLLIEFNDIGVETVLFSGGDPLLIKDDVWDIILKNQGKLSYGMLTAGNVHFKRWDEIVPAFKWIRFSVDALDANIYKSIRGVVLNKFLMENLKAVSLRITNENQCRLNFVDLKGVNETEKQKIENLAKELKISFKCHDVHTFTELGSTWNAEVKKCIVPLLYAIIECDGYVHSCCIIMDENNEYDKVRNDLSLGNIFEYNKFLDLWFSEKAQIQKKKLMDAQLDYCKKWCLPRYYEVNHEYHKLKDGGIFL